MIMPFSYICTKNSKRKFFFCSLHFTIAHLYYHFNFFFTYIYKYVHKLTCVSNVMVLYMKRE